LPGMRGFHQAQHKAHQKQGHRRQTTGHPDPATVPCSIVNTDHSTRLMP
jgi:hypothetical protein